MRYLTFKFCSRMNVDCFPGFWLNFLGEEDAHMGSYSREFWSGTLLIHDHGRPICESALDIESDLLTILHILVYLPLLSFVYWEHYLWKRKKRLYQMGWWITMFVSCLSFKYFVHWIKKIKMEKKTWKEENLEKGAWKTEHLTNPRNDW